MPVSITVRNLPDDVRDELGARAARSGRSLQEFMRAHLIQVASQPSLDEVVSRARHRLASTGTVLDVKGVLSDRDADRR